MGLKDILGGWTHPMDHYGDPLSLQQGVPNPHPHANAIQNAAKQLGLQGQAQGYNSASQAQQAAIMQMQAYQARQTQAQRTDVAKVNLNEGAWAATISQLADLWVVKFGSRWVSHNEIANDDFYIVALARLSKMRMIEEHHLQGHFDAVYKIVE